MALSENKEKKTLLEMNASWPLLIVYLGYLIGIYFLVQSLTNGNLPAAANAYGFSFGTLFIGLILTLLVYNAGKIAFAALAGYRINYLKVLGFVGERRGGKLKFRFDVLALLDLALSFSPKDDDIEKNPSLIFLGGAVFEVVLLVVAFLIFFLTGKEEGTMSFAISRGALAAALYGFIIPLYELVPFRQDYPNDMFNLIVTRKKEDKRAYNIVKVNERREFDGENFLVEEFDDSHSYYRSEVLCYRYLDELYRNELEKAVKTLSEIKRLSVALPEDRKYFPSKENAYFCFLTGDVRKADQIFFEMKKDFRKQITSPSLLEDYRIALFVTKDKESMDNLFKDYRKLLSQLKETERVAKEKALFRQVYEGIKKTMPDQYLPPLEESAN